MLGIRSIERVLVGSRRLRLGLKWITVMQSCAIVLCCGGVEVASCSSFLCHCGSRVSLHVHYNRRSCALSTPASKEQRSVGNCVLSDGQCVRSCKLIVTSVVLTLIVGARMTHGTTDRGICKVEKMQC